MSGFFKSKSRKSFHELFSRSRSGSFDTSKIAAEANSDPSNSNGNNSNDNPTSNNSSNEMSQSAENANSSKSITSRTRKYFTRSRKFEVKSESRIVISSIYDNELGVKNGENSGTNGVITQYDLTQFIIDGYKPSSLVVSASCSNLTASKASSEVTPKRENKREFVLQLDARKVTQFTSFHAAVARSFIRKGAKPITYWKFPAYRIKFLTPMSDESRVPSIGWHRTPGAILEYEHLREIQSLPLWIDCEEVCYNPESDVDMSVNDDDVDRNFDLAWDLYGFDASQIIGTDDLN